VVKKYQRPWIIRWRHKDFWPKGIYMGRPTIGFDDWEWSMYLLWLEGY